MKNKSSLYRLAIYRLYMHKLSITALITVFTLSAVLSSCTDGKNQAQNTTQATTIASDTTGIEEPSDTSDSIHESSDITTTTEPKPTPRPTPELTLLPPVEEKPPNTSYEPASAGQTRAPGTITQTEYSVTIISEDLESPWAVTSLPDNRIVITEKAGFLRILSADGILSEPIGGFPAVDNRSQGGLLDVAPAPDFLTSKLLYFTLAEATDQGSLTAVGRGRLSNDESVIENFEIIWRAIPYFDNSMHFGSRLAFDKDGYLFVTTGERSDLQTRPNAQLLDNGHGKVVRLTKEGKPAPNNPFAGVEGALPEIYTYGHRNVQGLAIEPITGQVLISEMGPRGGDELNLIEAGKNYGWPVISYGIKYSGDPIPGALTAQDGMEQPVYYWDPSLAPSGMTFYTSDKIAEWQGNLFIGGLVSQHIARLILENGRVIAEERLLANEGQRFRDIGESSDGSLYAVTDGGRLYKIY